MVRDTYARRVTHTMSDLHIAGSQYPSGIAHDPPSRAWNSERRGEAFEEAAGGDVAMTRRARAATGKVDGGDGLPGDVTA